MTQSEYAGVLKMRAHRLQAGNEIVGVWSHSSRTQMYDGQQGSVLLFRPDGTGVCRDIAMPDTWEIALLRRFAGTTQGGAESGLL